MDSDSLLTQVTAVDTSEQAAAWARYNVQRLGYQQRVQVLLGNWCEPVQHLAGTVAGILSNPPYITSEELAGLQTEVSLQISVCTKSRYIQTFAVLGYNANLSYNVNSKHRIDSLIWFGKQGRVFRMLQTGYLLHVCVRCRIC